MGVLLALIPAIGWGIQPLIARKIDGGPADQILGTGLGSLLVGLIIQVAFGSVSGGAFWLSFGAGFLWSLGQIGQFVAFNQIGVTRTMPISTGLQVVGTALIGVLAFGEWSSLSAKLIGILAILLLVIGVACTAVTDKKAEPGHSLVRGLAVLVPTTVGYWAYGALPKAVSAEGLQLFFPEMLGIFVGAVLYTLIRTHGHGFVQKQSWQNGIIGLIFGLSSLAYIFAAQSAGVATAFVITQLNVVVSTLGAMIVLKESKSKRELQFTLGGLGLIVIGSVITAFI